MMSIFCTAADDVSSGSWFIVSKVLVLNVPMLTILLHAYVYVESLC